MNKSLLGSATLGYSTLNLDGDGFLDRASLGFGLSKQLQPERRLSFQYRLTDNNYDHPTLVGALDRDGTSHLLAVNFHQRLGKWSTISGLQLHSDNAVGNSYDATNYALQFRVSRELPSITWRTHSYPLKFSAYLRLSRTEYDGVNALAPVKRSDDAIQTALAIISRFSKKISAEIQLRHLNNRSNIAFFEYDQTQLAVSITATF